MEIYTILETKEDLPGDSQNKQNRRGFVGIYDWDVEIGGEILNHFLKFRKYIVIGTTWNWYIAPGEHSVAFLAALVSTEEMSICIWLLAKQEASSLQCWWGPLELLLLASATMCSELINAFLLERLLIARQSLCVKLMESNRRVLAVSLFPHAGAELPQKGLRLRATEPWWLPSWHAMLAVMGSLTAAERTARLLYEHWGASTSATLMMDSWIDLHWILDFPHCSLNICCRSQI
jgi:hypothetical protein